MFAWVYSGARNGHQFHSDSRGFSRAPIGFSGFIRVHVHLRSHVFTLARVGIDVYTLVRKGSLVRAKVSTGSSGFTRVHWEGRRDHSGSRGSLRRT